MTKNGADVKAAHYFELQDESRQIKKELDKAKTELVEILQTRRTDLIIEGKTVNLAEWEQTTVKWKNLYLEAYDRLDKPDRKTMKKMQDRSTSYHSKNKITLG